MTNQILRIFQEAFLQLRPQAALPEIAVTFYSYASINNTIRLRKGKLLIRISDLLEGAPDQILNSLAHILLAKMYRLPVRRSEMTTYRTYIAGHEIRHKSHLAKQLRGRKRLNAAHGNHYDLDVIFDQLNGKFFHGLLARPRMSWSQNGARRMLGHFDPAHNTIIVSQIFDHPSVPRCAVEYIVYHEMLHLKHPVRLQGSRRCVHSAEFRKEERLFPALEAAQRFLRTI